MTKQLIEIRRRADDSGFYKQAFVEGERFPDVFFSDPLIADVVASLRARGVSLPDEIVYTDYTKDSPAYDAESRLIDGRVKMHFDVNQNELVVQRPDTQLAAKPKGGLGL